MTTVFVRSPSPPLASGNSTGRGSGPSATGAGPSFGGSLSAAGWTTVSSEVPVPGVSGWNLLLMTGPGGPTSTATRANVAHARTMHTANQRNMGRSSKPCASGPLASRGCQPPEPAGQQVSFSEEEQSLLVNE